MREIRFRSWYGWSKKFMYATVERPFDENFPSKIIRKARQIFERRWRANKLQPWKTG